MSSLPPWSRVDRYVIEERRIGAPLAEVYRAFDKIEGKKVALEMFPKVLETDICRRFDVFMGQFGGVELPGIPEVLDSGIDEGRPFVVRVWVEGDTLATLRAGRGPMRADEAVCLLLRVTDQLAIAHDRGLIHGEVSSANLRVDPGGLIFLEGFGSAALRSAATEVGTVGGDVAGLANVLAELLAGQRAVRSKELLASGLETGLAHRLAAQLRSKSSQADLAAIIHRAKTAGGRFSHRAYGSVAEFAADLRAWLLGRPVDVRPRSFVERGLYWCRLHPIGTVVVGLVLAGMLGAPVLGWWWFKSHGLPGSATLSGSQRADFDYVAGIQRAHAALEAGAMERFEALLTPTGNAAQVIPGPERGLLRAWLEVQPRERLINLISPVEGLSVSPDGSRLVAWSQRGAEVLGARARQPPTPLRMLGTNSALAVDFLPDGRTAVVGTAAGIFLSPLVGDSSTALLQPLFGEGTARLAVSPDARWIAAVGLSNTPPLTVKPRRTSGALESPGWSINIVPLIDGVATIPVRLPLGPVLAWSWIEPEPGASRLAVALRDGQAGTWDLLKTNYFGLVRSEGEWTAAAWDRRGRLLARLDAAGALEIISFSTGELIARREGFAAKKQLLTVASDGSRIAAITTGGDVAIYTAPEWLNFAILPTRREDLTVLSFLPDGALLTGMRNGTVWRWEPQSGTPRPGTVTTNHLQFTTGRPCFNPDASWLALPNERQSEEDRCVVQEQGRLGNSAVLLGLPVGFLNPEVLLIWERIVGRWEAWSIPTRVRLGTGKLADLEAWNWGTLSEDGKVLVAQSPGDRLEAFDSTTGKPLARLDEKTEAVALSADGSIVSVCLGESIGLWTPRSGVLRRLPGMKPLVTAVSSDGQVAAFGDDHGHIRIWRPAVNQTEDLPADPAAIHALAFGGEGRTLFVANGANLLQAWHLGTRQELFSRSLSYSAEWLVMAPHDMGLLVGHPAPPGESTGTTWWWPVSTADRFRTPVRSGSSTVAPIPAWLNSGKKH